MKCKYRAHLCRSLSLSLYMARGGAVQSRIILHVGGAAITCYERQRLSSAGGIYINI